MRAMWSGAVSFGLVSVPVKAYSATTNHDIRFHQVHGTDGGRIKYKRTCSVDGEEVEYAEIVKGYETDDGELITLSEEDLDSLPTATGHEIDVIEFVPADQIDPLLFEKSYYLEPDAKAAKPYALLREALVQTDRMAVVKVALRQRESMALLRVRDKAIVLQTMLWPDEVRDGSFAAPAADVEVRPQEVAMAESYIQTLETTFDPDRYHDEYRAALEQVIDAKTAGREVEVPKAAPAKGEVVDLMAALQASVDEARRQRGETPAESGGRANRQPAAKKAATKKATAKKTTTKKTATKKATAKTAKKAPAKKAQKAPARKSA
jgi:DNA end-binding protein Ku